MSDLYNEVLAIASAQKSVDWHKVRLGRFTASEFHKLMTEPKLVDDKKAGNLSDGAKTYVLKKVAEKLTGQQSTQPFTAAINHGEEYENEAREFYSQATGNEITRVNFVVYGENAGGSPDGNIREDGQIEIKCPFESSNHVLYHTFKTAKDLEKNCRDYWFQIQCNLLFSKRLWCDFISYDPRFHNKYKMKVLHIEADTNCFEQILAKLAKAEAYRNEIISIIKGNTVLMAELDQHNNIMVTEK